MAEHRVCQQDAEPDTQAVIAAAGEDRQPDLRREAPAGVAALEQRRQIVARVAVETRERNAWERTRRVRRRCRRWRP